jgi:transcriptional regulator with PAS, ATPase and Fis domain
LYGHEKGSFTGAYKAQPGQFEIAADGTIFLDEIADIPLSLQSKLLRFLQEKEYQPVGSSQPKKSNARIIVATNRDLFRAISDGRFRKDLYYRLKVLTIFIPPLRDRREDIPLLIRHFLHKINSRHQTGVLRIEDRAVQALMEYDWPGNVRELENLLTQACVLGRDAVILEDIVKSILDKSLRLPPGREPVPTLADTEKNAVRNAIMFTRGNLSEAARLLNISRPTLRSKIRKYGLEIQRDSGKNLSI